MKALSLFSGIGGIDLACEWAGIETVAFCEREPFPQKVLKKHWPDVPIYDDVCTLTKERLDADGIGTIDIIHGGYPCQPFSLAGKREGEKDDRHLWPEVFRLIQTIKPRWFIGENVAGHVTLGLDIVLSDLESIGYAWEAFVLPAASVNAQHRRDRVFIVAHPNSIGNDSKAGFRIDRNRQKEVQKRFESFVRFSYKGEDVGYTECLGRNRQPWRRAEQIPTDGHFKLEEKHDTHTDSAGFKKQYITTVTDHPGFSTWGTPSGRDQWAVEPDVGRVANGVPQRVDRLKALGNAVVPQQIYPILAAIKQIDDMIKKES